MHKNVLLLKKLVTESNFLIFGQYVHLPSLVPTGIMTLGLSGLSMGGNLTLAEMSLSLKLGRLLKPIIGVSGKMVFNSSVFWIMFQLSQISLVTLGFLGLKLVTITGLVDSNLVLTSSN